MKEITNYRETSENSSEGSVKENINKPISGKAVILNYFRQCHENFTVVTCAAVDHITGKPLNGESIRTYDDGSYCWTNEEELLFEKYDLKLNDDFIAHVMSKTSE